MLNFHPHLHVMATDGGFTPEGIFHPLPTLSLAPLEQLFRHRVFRMLRRKGLLTRERIKLLQSWEHSGFNVYASVRIRADDTAGRENLARYLIRAPFSMDKIRCDAAAQTVIYKTRMVGAEQKLRDLRPAGLPRRGHLPHSQTRRAPGPILRLLPESWGVTQYASALRGTSAGPPRSERLDKHVPCQENRLHQDRKCPPKSYSAEGRWSGCERQFL